MAHSLVCPPWKANGQLGLKLIRKNRIRAKGLSPLPQSKAEQRAIAATLASQPATTIPTGKRALPQPYNMLLGSPRST